MPGHERRRSRRRWGPIVVVIAGLVGSTASADGDGAWNKYGKKVSVACGADFSIEWDMASLKEHVAWIRHGQVSGGRYCNEPLRYMWQLCQTKKGKAKVKKVKKLLCKGTAAKTGKVSFKRGIVVVEVANEEKKPYLRARAEFEKALKLTVALEHQDPYRDQAWRELGLAPNPVTDTRNYCMVGGANEKTKKVELSESEHSSFVHQKRSGKVRCWREGKLVVDLTVVDGKLNGFATTSRRESSTKTSYKDGKRHGELKRTDKGKVRSVAWYEDGKEVWERSFHDDGRLKEYEHNFNPHGYKRKDAEVRYSKTGKLTRIECRPEAVADDFFTDLCGFDRPATHDIYDGRGEVRKTVTFDQGLLASQEAGSAGRGGGSTVKFKDGKKHGVEKISDAKGRVVTVVQWDRGVRHGLATYYDDKEDKVVREVEWKKGKVVVETEYYLNGNKREIVEHDGANRRRVKEFHDNGKLRREGEVERCRRWYWTSWCETGEHRVFAKEGYKAAVETYADDYTLEKRISFHENGEVLHDERFTDDRLSSLKTYDETGKLVFAEEYEADGSQKAPE